MRILGIPYCSREGEVAANVAGAIAVIREELRRQPADLVVLPELFTCGYCAPVLEPYAETLDGPAVREFRRCSEELGVSIGFGLAETSGSSRVYNSWVLVEPGAPVQVYRKTHLHPSCHPKGNEPAFLLPGNELQPLRSRLGSIGVMICYDGCFVEVARSLALRGADLIVWPTRSGTYLASQSLTPVRALDNTIPIVQVEGGQTGAYQPLGAWSMAASATGRLLLSQRDDDRPFWVELDVAEGRRLRASGDAGGHSLYQPRRPELYATLGAAPGAGDV